MITVTDIMTPNPLTVTRDTPLETVIGLMKSNACRHLLVVEDQALVGIITDRDVRLAMNSPLVLREKMQDLTLLRDVTAEACMTADPLTITADAPAAEAAALMRKFSFSALPVMEEALLVGIVTVSDILDSFIAVMREEMTAED